MDRVPSHPRQTPPGEGEPSLPAEVMAALRVTPSAAKPIPPEFDHKVLSAAARELGGLESAELQAPTGAAQHAPRPRAIGHQAQTRRRRTGGLGSLVWAHPRASWLAAASVAMVAGLAWIFTPAAPPAPSTIADASGSTFAKSEWLRLGEPSAVPAMPGGTPPNSSGSPAGDMASAMAELTPLDATRTPTIVDAFRLARAVRSGEVLPEGWDLNADGAINDDDVRELAMRAVRLEGRFSHLSPQQRKAMVETLLAHLNLNTKDHGGGA